MFGTERNSGRELRCLYVGAGDNFEYLKELIYSGDVVTESEGPPIAAFRVGQAVRCFESEADLVVLDLCWPFYRLVDSGKYLAVPSWIGQWLPLASPWADTWGAVTRDGKRNLSRIRKYGVEARVTWDEKDHDEFYDTMYLPHVRRRFGDTAVVDPRHVVRSVCRRSGLLQIVYGKAVVGGTALWGSGSRLETLWDGFAEVDCRRGDFRATLVGALYYYSMVYAHESGFQVLEVGGSRPFLRDGPLRYKRKWGARVHWLPHPHRMLFRARRSSEAVAGFFAGNPFLVSTPEGLRARVLQADAPLSAENIASVVAEASHGGVSGIDVVATSGVKSSARAYLRKHPEVRVHDLSVVREGGLALGAQPAE